MPATVKEGVLQAFEDHHGRGGDRGPHRDLLSRQSSNRWDY